MNLPAYLIALLSVIAVIIQAASLFLSLKLFRCPSDRQVLLKVVGLQTAFLAVIGLSTTFAPGGLAGLLNLIYFVGGVAVWFMLLKRFVANNYGFGKAISSYLVSYVLSTSLLVGLAVIGIVFFAQVFTISGSSMAPALTANQTVLVYKFEQRPVNNNIIVYKSSNGNKSLGRVHGTPGQTVAIADGQVEIQGKLQQVKSYTLGDNQYYVTADNSAYHIPARIITQSTIVGIIGPKL
jgi:signal peptidase I